MRWLLRSKAEEHIAVALTKKQIEGSPSLSNDQPVSRQFEESYYGYYGWPMYWGGSFMWGSYPCISRDREQWKKSAQGEKAWDPHLRSTDSVQGRNIQALDGEIGHVEDFIIDDETWAIRYLVVDTRNWRSGKTVLVSLRWIERVSWSESKVFVNLSREAITVRRIHGGFSADAGLRNGTSSALPARRLLERRMRRQITLTGFSREKKPSR